MEKIVYLIIGCFWLTSCGDFLKESSQELVYATSCRDLDEVMIGNGYYGHSLLSGFVSSSIVENEKNNVYYVWLQVMDDDVEEVGFGNYSLEGSGACAVLRPFYSWDKVPFQNVKGVPYDDITWRKLYNHIGYLNVILSQVKEFTSDPEIMRRRIIGEAQFLRAFNYYTLVNMYANPYVKETASKDDGVPLKLTEEIEDKYFGRNSVAEVYEQIVADLKFAAENLKGIQQATVYRVNEAAVRTFLSRVYLYMGEYQLAWDECEKVLKLGAPLRDMNNLNLSDKAPVGGVASKVDYMNTVESPEIMFTQGSNGMNLLMVDNSSTAGLYRASDELIDLYTKYAADGVSDLRLNGYFSKVVKNLSYRFSRKTSGILNEITTFDCCLIRSAEVFLNKAEAEVMLDGDAVSTLKAFMPYRYAGKLPAIEGLTGKELMAFVREERRRELCFESQRWFDLRRYAVSPKYPETKPIRHAVYSPGEQATSSAIYDGTYVLETYEKETAYVMPIPGYEITFNRGAMVDNPEREKRVKQ